MTTPREMGWQEAVLTILEEAEEPLHYNEITSRIGERGLRTLTGATPAFTVNRTLRTLVGDHKVLCTSSGLYALPEMARRSDEIASAEEIEAEAAAASLDKFTVKAYGLYWERSLVDWRPTNGAVWGQQDEKSTPVNFADQDGIYLLHKGSEVCYVGQTRTVKGQSGLYARLRYHHRDARKADRWDTFSWFGFKPVGESGDLLPAPDVGNLGDVIDVIEAVFIEGFMPRLNMRAGDGAKELRDIGLYRQSVFQGTTRWGR